MPLRENLVEWVFAYYHWTEMLEKEPTPGGLAKFHAAQTTNPKGGSPMIQHASLLAKNVLLMVLVLPILMSPGNTHSIDSVDAHDETDASPTTVPLSLHISKISAADGAKYEYFGSSVSICGDTIVVGAPFARIAGDPARGAAYVYEKSSSSGSQWSEVRKLAASDGQDNDFFGVSVAISGDIVVVGAHAVDNYRGAAYVFERHEGGVDSWGQVAKLTEPDGAEWNEFGSSVAVNGDLVVVGAWLSAVDGNTKQGSGYVFHRNRGGTDNWGLAAKLTASDGLPYDQFGRSVSLTEDTIVVGAPGVTVAGNSYQGAAYIYSRTEGRFDQWVEVSKLTATDGTPSDWLGLSVSIYADIVVTGAPGVDINGNLDQGAVYVFARNKDGSGSWGQTARITASEGMANDRFGDPIVVSRGLIGAAVHGRHTAGIGAQGEVHVYGPSQDTSDAWRLICRLIAPDGMVGDEMGYSLSMEGLTIVAGAPYSTVNSNDGQGAAYVFQGHRLFLPLIFRCFVPPPVSGSVGLASSPVARPRLVTRRAIRADTAMLSCRLSPVL